MFFIFKFSCLIWICIPLKNQINHLISAQRLSWNWTELGQWLSVCSETICWRNIHFVINPQQIYQLYIQCSLFCWPSDMFFNGSLAVLFTFFPSFALCVFLNGKLTITMCIFSALNTQYESQKVCREYNCSLKSHAPLLLRAGCGSRKCPFPCEEI